MTERTTLTQRLTYLSEKDSSQLDIDAPTEARIYVRTAMAEVEREVALLAAEAQQVASAFWSLAISARKDVPGDKRSFLGTRVRMIKGTLSIEWYRNGVSFNVDGTVKSVLSKRINKGISCSYPKSAFTKEPEWIKESVEIAENKYSKIRERAAILTKIKRNLRAYDKLIES
jgi:hypothetical protein